jgi:hypothetical protein
VVVVVLGPKQQIMCSPLRELPQRVELWVMVAILTQLPLVQGVTATLGRDRGLGMFHLLPRMFMVPVAAEENSQPQQHKLGAREEVLLPVGGHQSSLVGLAATVAVLYLSRQAVVGLRALLVMV